MTLCSKGGAGSRTIRPVACWSHLARSCGACESCLGRNAGTIRSIARGRSVKSGKLRADAVQAGLITQQAADVGLQAFTWTGRSGQVWVTVRNGVIQNAGVNPLGAFR